MNLADLTNCQKFDAHTLYACLFGPASEDDGGCLSRGAAGKQVPALVTQLPLLELLTVTHHV